MDIRTDINPPSFTFGRSFWEAGQRLGDEDRLRFYDGLCEVAFERRMPEPPAEGEFDALSVAFALALPTVEQSCAKNAGGHRGGRPARS